MGYDEINLNVKNGFFIELKFNKIFFNIINIKGWMSFL